MLCKLNLNSLCDLINSVPLRENLRAKLKNFCMAKLAAEMPQIEMLPKVMDASFRKCYQS